MVVRGHRRVKLVGLISGWVSILLLLQGGCDDSPPFYVDPEPNAAPVVDAGVDQAIVLPAGAGLDGTVTDDGHPVDPGTVTTAWSAVSGPGTVTFGDASAVDTTASFSAVGDYVLRLTADDGELQASDDVTVTVDPEPVNQAPVVDAGANQTISLPDSASLNGTVTDDGLPNPPAAVAAAWTAVSGPGTVTFGDASAADTTASFSEAGVYILRLTADDGELQASDEVTVDVGVQGDVDLVVSSVSGSAASAENGETLTATVTVANSLAGAAGEFATGIYLSTDATISPSADTLLGRFDLSGLIGGASQTQWVEVRVPGSIAAGTYFLGAYADFTLAVAEIDEANNGLAAAATLDVSAPAVMPDLLVTQFTAPSNIRAGETILLSAAVLNVGSFGSSGPFRVGFYLSIDATIDPATDTLLATRDVSGLDPGEEATGLSTAATLPASLASGSYFLGVYADDLAAVPEQDETNNAAAQAASTPGAQPDLQPSSSTSPWGTTRGSPGQTVTVNAGIRNFGDLDAPASRAAFYLSADPVFDGGDTLLGDVAVSALNGYGFGDSDSVSLDWTAPSTLATYYLFVLVDSSNDVAESSETNNVGGPMSFTVVPLTLADLVPNAPNVYLGSAYAPGGEINVLATIANNGSTSVASGDYRVGFYLSADPDITTVDTLLGTSRGSVSVSISTTIPLGTTPGNYYVGLVADDQFEVAESNENNNASPGHAILVLGAGKAELEIRTFCTLGDLTFSPGETMDLYTWIDNSGIVSSGSFQVDYYLSADAFIDPAADTLIGTWSPAGIDPGDYAQGTRTLTVPGGTPPGTYYLGLLADSQGQVDEPSEGNNTALAKSGIMSDDPVVVVTILGGEGLTDLSGFVSGSFGAIPAGTQASFYISVRNTGAATATPFRAGVYLSDNSSVTTADAFIGSVMYDTGIGAVTENQERVTVTVPSDLAPGSYYLGVVADDTDLIAEADESNNAEPPVFVVQVTAGPPDLVVGDIQAWYVRQLYPGGQIRVKVGVWNVGGSSSGSFAVTFYLSTDETIDAATDTFVGTVDVRAIAPASAEIAELSWVLPTGLAAGTYYLGAIADEQDTVMEADETNNVNAWAISVLDQTDLTWSNTLGISFPQSAAAGQPLTLSIFFWWLPVDVNGPLASTTYRTGIYLSADAVITTADTLIGWKRTDGAVSEPVIPAGTTPGQYYVGGVLDDLNEIVEADETNNASQGEPFTVVATLEPDLTIGEISLPTAVALKSGVPYLIAVETVNLGGAVCALSVTGIYVSTDATITAGDTLLAALPVRVLPAGNATYDNANETTIILPAGLTTGTYYIGALADRDGAVTEISETNNAASAAVEVTDTDRTDLTAGDLTAPSSLVRGLALAEWGPPWVRAPSVSVTLWNQGTTAETFRVGFYLSADQVFSANDTYLAGSIHSLQPGQEVDAYRSVTAPASLAPGTYYILAVVDDLDQVAEEEEANNVAVSEQVDVR